MKKKYEKPEVITEDISTTFAGACCSDTDYINWNPAHVIIPCHNPACHYELNSYEAT
ncbi:MAG: hypothetical protein JW913_20540 [Chitinispirillaceae bacterium]|nr:hypothetical protein [Chitinispirillaceae bacterium]